MSEARAQFARALERAEHGQPVEVTRAGRSIAVLVSPEQFHRLESPGATVRAALEKFLDETNPADLRGPDPMRRARDRTPGRVVRW